MKEKKRRIKREFQRRGGANASGVKGNRLIHRKKKKHPWGTIKGQWRGKEPQISRLRVLAKLSGKGEGDGVLKSVYSPRLSASPRLDRLSEVTVIPV